MTQPAQQPEAQDLKAIEDYIYSSINHTEEWKKAEQAYQNILNTRSRPHTRTHLTKFVEHLSRIYQELGVVSGKLENLQKIIDADEMTYCLWEDYENLEGWREALDWAILTDSDFTLQQHDTTIRNATLSPIKEIYERFKHLDKILSAKDVDCPMRLSYSEIWIAVRELCEGTNHDH